MRVIIGTNRLISPRGRLVAVVLLSGVAVAGCGGSSRSETTPTAGGVTSSAPSATRSGSSASRAGGSGPLAFARCMRADGVPHFPDPDPGGNFDLSFAAGVDPSSPAFKAAQA